MMQFRILFLCVCFSTSFVHSQNYAEVDKIIYSYPKYFSSLDSLAKRIDYDFHSEENKIRAIYKWLVLNITYGFPEIEETQNIWLYYYSEEDRENKIKAIIEKRLEEKLKQKKAVCNGFSGIFKSVCDRLGIEAVIIYGFSKTKINDIGNERSYKDHSWNAVKVNGVWKLLDITWSSSYENNDQQTWSKSASEFYYFTIPSEFVTNHYPINTYWQLLPNPISKKMFFQDPIFYPSYFKNFILLANEQQGVVNISKNRIKIYFDSFPKNKNFYYSFNGSNIVEPLVKIRRTQNNQYVAILHTSGKKYTQLTLFEEFTPVLDFRINVEK